METDEIMQFFFKDKKSCKNFEAIEQKKYQAPLFHIQGKICLSASIAKKYNRIHSISENSSDKKFIQKISDRTINSVIQGRGGKYSRITKN